MSQAEILGEVTPSNQKMRLFEATVPAGFPSPALDHMEQKISLDVLLDLNAPQTYLVRVSGDSMIGEGIFDGDILIVRRSLTAGHGDIVVAAINGEVFVKRFHKKNDQIILMSANPKYPPRYILEGDELQVWGVVRQSVRWHYTSDKA